MKNNVVKVLLWGKEICRLQWQGGYREKFGKVGSLISFNPDYKSYGFDVDPLGIYNSNSLFVKKGLSDICRARDNEGLPRFLGGSLPDDWGNQVFASWIERNKIRSHDVTVVDKLAFIGKRGMGAFEFIPELYSPSSDDAVQIEELYELAREIQEAREQKLFNLSHSPAINDLMEVGMSAGGRHPKAIVSINWETGDIRSGQIPLPEGFKHYILKFKDSHTLPTSELEYCYFRMARNAGIEMQDSRLLLAGGVRHFLTERFDRSNGSKIHSTTLHALCGETCSYEDIFAACRRLHLPQVDLEQLYRRTVFNYLACVCDDHDKNFSFTMTSDGVWRLSPAYDVAFTYNLENRFRGGRHVMTIEECDRDISKEQFLRLAEQNDIRGAELIIEEVQSAIGGFAGIAKETGISDSVISLVRDCLPSL